MKRDGKEFENLTDADIKRVASEIITEIVIDFQMTLFAELEKVLPDFAKELRPDYEKWVNLESSMQKETSGSFSCSDIARRLPNNQWWQFLTEVGDHLSRQGMLVSDDDDEEGEDEKIGEYLISKVADRFLKKDVS